MKVNELLNVAIEDLVLGGDALAHHEGRVVFVDRGLPADRLEARVTRIRKRYAEARAVRVLEPSPHRIAARCPHVGVCGGCRFQELAYAEQCVAKERQVRETLVRLGGIAAPDVRSIVPAPEAFGYRNKMEFTFAPDDAGAPRLGLHERGAFDRVFELETCLLASPLTVEIVRFTQRFAREHGWRAYHPRQHQGVVRFLIVRHLPLTDQCAVHLIAASEEIPALAEWTSGVAALAPTVKTVTLGLNRGRAAVAFAEEERLLHGPGFVVERLLGLEFEAGGNVFLQTNSRQAEALYASALEAAALKGGETVLDLYSGSGTLTLLFARRAAAAVGVEDVADSVKRAIRNARRNGVTNARFVEGDARRVLREWARGERESPPRPDVVVVDPPRAGLHPRVVARVAELLPSRIVYVSCNPGTLARDLGDFAGRGYAVGPVRPFDLFPHTPHIECVVRLDRVAGNVHEA